MTKLYIYKLDLWFRSNDEKDFMTREVIAASDEEAKSLGRQIRRNVYHVDILSKEPYVERN